MNTYIKIISDWIKSRMIWISNNYKDSVKKVLDKKPEWMDSTAFRTKATQVSFVITLLIFILLYIQFLAPAILESSFLFIPKYKTEAVLDSVQLNTLENALSLKTKELERKINQISKTPYIVINSTENNFQLYSGGNLVREGVCSTGSYVKLEYNDKQQWVFRTPKGMLKIRNKTKFPVWKKPDWAFIEEGKPVPSPNHPSRYEYGVLGDYSLALGDGYLIHGTLYQRLLGLPVTHGCVRLGDSDLESVYRTLRIGDRVFIY